MRIIIPEGNLMIPVLIGIKIKGQYSAVLSTSWEPINIMNLFNDKMDFTKTPEPKGRITKKMSGDSIFIIQKHDATNLHYNFQWK